MPHRIHSIHHTIANIGVVIIATLLYISQCTIFVSGRVHSAVVSGINLEQRTVTVEWFERGETKGKEVSAARIIPSRLRLHKARELQLSKEIVRFEEKKKKQFMEGKSVRFCIKENIQTSLDISFFIRLVVKIDLN